MIYIVSGHPRTGTSMMMKALSEGGLSAAFDPQRDEYITRCADELYKPNPHGVFEIPQGEYWEPGFPLKYAGKLIKVFHGGLRNLAKHQYKIVFMLRDPEEIRQSFEAMFYKVSYFSTALGRRFNVDEYEAEMQSTLNYLSTRTDVDVTTLQYVEVINEPEPTFSRLADSGWPIDVARAAGVVDPSLYRFRRELLTVGA